MVSFAYNTFAHLFESLSARRPRSPEGSSYKRLLQPRINTAIAKHLDWESLHKWTLALGNSGPSFRKMLRDVLLVNPSPRYLPSSPTCPVTLSITPKDFSKILMVVEGLTNKSLAKSRRGFELTYPEIIYGAAAAITKLGLPDQAPAKLQKFFRSLPQLLVQIDGKIHNIFKVNYLLLFLEGHKNNDRLFLQKLIEDLGTQAPTIRNTVDQVFARALRLYNQDLITTLFHLQDACKSGPDLLTAAHLETALTQAISMKTPKSLEIASMILKKRGLMTREGLRSCFFAAIKYNNQKAVALFLKENGKQSFFNAQHFVSYLSNTSVSYDPSCMIRTVISHPSLQDATIADRARRKKSAIQNIWNLSMRKPCFHVLMICMQCHRSSLSNVQAYSTLLRFLTREPFSAHLHIETSHFSGNLFAQDTNMSSKFAANLIRALTPEDLRLCKPLILAAARQSAAFSISISQIRIKRLINPRNPCKSLRIFSEKEFAESFYHTASSFHHQGCALENFFKTFPYRIKNIRGEYNNVFSHYLLAILRKGLEERDQNFLQSVVSHVLNDPILCPTDRLSHTIFDKLIEASTSEPNGYLLLEEIFTLHNDSPHKFLTWESIAPTLRKATEVLPAQGGNIVRTILNRAKADLLRNETKMSCFLNAFSAYNQEVIDIFLEHNRVSFFFDFGEFCNWAQHAGKGAYYRAHRTFFDQPQLIRSNRARIPSMITQILSHPSLGQWCADDNAVSELFDFAIAEGWEEVVATCLRRYPHSLRPHQAYPALNRYVEQGVWDLASDIASTFHDTNVPHFREAMLRAIHRSARFLQTCLEVGALEQWVIKDQPTQKTIDLLDTFLLRSNNLGALQFLSKPAIALFLQAATLESEKVVGQISLLFMKVRSGALPFEFTNTTGQQRDTITTLLACVPSKKVSALISREVNNACFERNLKLAFALLQQSVTPSMSSSFEAFYRAFQQNEPSLITPICQKHPRLILVKHAAYLCYKISQIFAGFSSLFPYLNRALQPLLLFDDLIFFPVKILLKKMGVHAFFSNYFRKTFENSSSNPKSALSEVSYPPISESPYAQN
ncbi:MAG: hypothetical protein AAGI90_03620 [Chlamydiota bacterium]